MKSEFESRMRGREAEESAGLFSFESLHQVIRAAAGVLGVVIIVIGLVFAMRLFAALLGTLRNPEGIQPQVAQWATVLGGDELTVVIAGNKYPCGRIVAVIVLGGGSVVLAWIAMGLTLTGAKLVSWTLGEREAIKRILNHAFGTGGVAGARRVKGDGAGSGQ